MAMGHERNLVATQRHHAPTGPGQPGAVATRRPQVLAHVPTRPNSRKTSSRGPSSMTASAVSARSGGLRRLLPSSPASTVPYQSVPILPRAGVATATATASALAAATLTTSSTPSGSDNSGGDGSNGPGGGRGGDDGGGGGGEPPALAALRRAAGADLLRVADGPMGRGLFTAGPVGRNRPLLSMPDVCTLIVPDPENEPTDDGPNGGGEDSNGNGNGDNGSRYYSAEEHLCYMQRWQQHHGLSIPEGLQELLCDCTSLPAPVRLALWLMWLRRQCGPEGGSSSSSTRASAATAATASDASSYSSRSGSGGSDGSSGSGGSDGSSGSAPATNRGPAYWRGYCASLPRPGDVTCPSAFNEEEEAALQVPGYRQQWRRTRDNLTWLLEVANQAFPVGGETTTPAAEAGSGGGPQDGSSSGVAAAVAGASGGGGGGGSYSLPELCYCFALCTSRCFHLPGRMLQVPFADLGNHLPLWQVTAYPYWEANDSYVTGSSSEDDEYGNGSSMAASGDGGGGSGSGWFQFRAARELPPGTEVCICYSEGDNAEQLFSYGFVRQANPYDRVDLNPHRPWPPTLHGEDCAWREGGRLPQGTSLCWPAVVAAAGFWAAAQDDASAANAAGGSTGRDEAAVTVVDSGGIDGDGGDSEAAAEQAMLQPRGSGLLRMVTAASVAAAAVAAAGVGGGGGGSSVVDLAPAERLRLQRRRSALLSLPHTAADTAALRRRGLSWAAAPAAELTRALAESVGRGGMAAAVASELAAVAALEQLVVEMGSEMGSTLERDEAVWSVLTREAEAPSLAALVAAAGGGGVVGALRGLFGGLGKPGGTLPGGMKVTPADMVAEAALYDRPRGRTALLARLEYKRILAEAHDILQVYRMAVESVA